MVSPTPRIAALDYSAIRCALRPGDVVAFSGKGRVSEIIKWATRSPVSHVGVVLRSVLTGEAWGTANDHGATLLDGSMVHLIESTALNGIAGVQVSRMSERLEVYSGDVWILPLHPRIRELLDLEAFLSFLLHAKGRPYDAAGAVLAGLDALDGVGLTRAREDFGRFFCSELVAGALEAGGVLEGINASEETPIDLVRRALYGPTYYHLKRPGGVRFLPGINTVP